MQLYASEMSSGEWYVGSEHDDRGWYGLASVGCAIETMIRIARGEL